jgi:hypothetical protein
LGLISIYIYWGGTAERSSSLKTEVKLSISQLKKVFVWKFNSGNRYGFQRFIGAGHPV